MQTAKLFINQSAGGQNKRIYSVKAQSWHKVEPTQDKLLILSICEVMPPEHSTRHSTDSPGGYGGAKEWWGQH